MEWLNVLKGLISAKVNAAIHLTANPNTNVIKAANKTTQTVTFKNKGNVNIFNLGNADKISPEIVKQLKEALLPAFEKEEIILLQQDSQNLLNSYKDFESHPDTKSLLVFFKGKISELDYRLLETGLYEAFLLENDLQKAQQVKADVVKRYGDRGKNILNLASGGYFATHIKPLYEALSAQESFDEADFSSEYEQIIQELPFAIFVHSGLNEADILIELTQKSEKNLRYGVKEETIILNGFGTNADRIERLIPELKNKYRRIAPTTHYLGTLKTIQLSVYYKELVG
ncbi:MAG TPA: hypothetical protein VH234_03550 [Candidatus Saccharimonadales bacterium]|jgi:hypothetical protein|nr:hypothetical protein [Candidatus Saccharimonadales bacterium]